MSGSRTCECAVRSALRFAGNRHFELSSGAATTFTEYSSSVMR